MEFLLDARYVAVCNNEACEYHNKVRKATLPYVGPGLVLEPRIYCACGHPAIVTPEVPMNVSIGPHAQSKPSPVV